MLSTFSFEPMEQFNDSPLNAVIESLAAQDKDGQLALQPWEFDLITNTAMACPGANWVMRHQESNAVIGAVIGGSCLGRATISHIFVDDLHRGNGAGKQVVESTLQSLRECGATKVHVIVTADNVRGRRFWQEHMGFKPVTERITLECDILDDSELPNFDEMSAADIGYAASLVPDHHSFATYLETVCAEPRGTCLVTRDDRGQIAGLAVVGSFGVRGFIDQIIAPTAERAYEIALAALKWLLNQGIRRVHAFVSPNSTLMLEALAKCGFCEQPGETTYEYAFT